MSKETIVNQHMACGLKLLWPEIPTLLFRSLLYMTARECTEVSILLLAETEIESVNAIYYIDIYMQNITYFF